MDISLFQLLIDKLGIFGFIIGITCFVVMMMGSLVDILQFWWVIRKLAKKKDRIARDKIRAELLLELHEKNK